MAARKKKRTGRGGAERGQGRHPKPDSLSQAHSLNVRLHADQRAYVDNLAAQLLITPTEAVRVIIDMARQGNPL